MRRSLDIPSIILKPDKYNRMSIRPLDLRLQNMIRLYLIIIFDEINSKANGNHEIKTQKTREEKISANPGYEPWSPKSQNQCPNNELY